MKTPEVTVSNISNIIREGVEKGTKSFYWNDKDWDTLRDFCKINGFGVIFFGAMHYPEAVKNSFLNPEAI